MACTLLIYAGLPAWSEGAQNQYCKGYVVSKGATDRQFGVLEQDKTKFIKVSISDSDNDCPNCLNCCEPLCDGDNVQVAVGGFYMKSADVDTVVADGGSATMTKAEFEAKITEIE